MRIVFDTNILVSALIFPGKQAHFALNRIIDGEDELLLSKPILDELLGVLARKFSRDGEELSRLALWLADLATWVNPTTRIRELDDEPDNRILECAVTGEAARVITGDKELLKLGSFRGIKIVTLRDYLS
jgi:uncharacterized protein